MYLANKSNGDILNYYILEIHELFNIALKQFIYVKYFY